MLGGSAKPALVRLWSKPGAVGMTGALPVAPGTVLTREGTLSLESGDLQKVAATPEQQNLLRLRSGVSLQDLTGTILTPTSVERWTAFLRDGTQRFAFVQKPSLRVAELGATGDEPWRTLGLRVGGGDTSVSASPDGQVFLFQSVIVHTGRESHSDEIVLRPLRRSSLRFFRFYDITDPGLGVLGVLPPKGVMREDAGMIPYGPESPLSLGDPYSGRVKWSNPDHGWGVWVGTRYVLASRPWAILDGATGREIATDVSDVLDGAEPYDVRASGRYILVRRHIEEATSTTCYRLDP